MSEGYRSVKIGLALLIASVMVASATAVSSYSVIAGKPSPPSADEQAFVAAIDDAYAWSMTQMMVDGRPVVAGTASSANAAEMLATEMENIGLEPGAENGYIEDFPIYGWEEISSSVTLVSPSVKSIPSAQAYKDVGTGPDGVTAPLVYINLARWGDFEKNDVKDKIVLFHRKNPMFYALPSLAEAKARGAVGALIDYPIISENGLKNDVTGVSIPAVYISNADSAYLQGLLAAGEDVQVKLVVDNKVGNYPNAHNVVGVIPGAVYPEEFVYVTAHFDHWFQSACDDGAGIGSLFAIAKAVKDSGIVPKRTLVFVAFDSEELGGQPDTWYDWCLGSYSHIVANLNGGPSLHPDRPGKIAGMLNMDVVGVKDALVFVETTPDLTQFFKIAARDSGLAATAPTSVYNPPSSYDDWQFYMMGIPVMQIAWWGPYYDTLYHTTDDTMDKIDPEHLHVNMVFTGLGMIRLSQRSIISYGLDENYNVAVKGIDNLLTKVPDVLGPNKADIRVLENGIADYYAAWKNALPKIAQKSPSVAEAARINHLMMASEVSLLPYIFDWDTSVVPGWTGLFLFDTYANDLQGMNAAIDHLLAGQTGKALVDLATITTMKWGQYVGEEAYEHVLSEIAYPVHPLWAAGHLPTLTNVHTEYMSLMGRLGSDGMSPADVLHSLILKRDAIYGYIDAASVEAGTAYSNAAAILMQI